MHGLLPCNSQVFGPLQQHPHTTNAHPQTQNTGETFWRFPMSTYTADIELQTHACRRATHRKSAQRPQNVCFGFFESSSLGAQDLCPSGQSCVKPPRFSRRATLWCKIRVCAHPPRTVPVHEPLPIETKTAVTPQLRAGSSSIFPFPRGRGSRTRELLPVDEIGSCAIPSLLIRTVFLVTR